MRSALFVLLALILISFGVGVYFFPAMPAMMASHWNVAGEVDGYLPKFWGLFLMPLILAGMIVLFLLIPLIDPLKENIKKFRRYFDGFIVLISLFLFYLYALTLVWNLGYRFDIGQMIVPALGLLFFYVGILFEHAKRNWFIGIRTPWTLSSDRVWEKTHMVGAKLFKASGVLAFLGLVIPAWAFWIALIPVIASSFYLVVYSYFEFRNETR